MALCGEAVTRAAADHADLWWIEGAITAAIAFIALLLLPRGPAFTRFLSERETAIAVTRVIRDDPSKVDESYSRKISLDDARQTFSNPRLYLVRPNARTRSDGLQHCAIGFAGGALARPTASADAQGYASTHSQPIRC